MQNYSKQVLSKISVFKRSLALRTFVSAPQKNIIRNTFKVHPTKLGLSYNYCTKSATQKLLRRNKNVTNINDLIKYIGQEQQFYLKLLTNIFDSIDFESISNEQAVIILSCCGNSVPDSSKETRNNVCQNIYKNLLKYNKLDLNVYHTYIQMCTENHTILNVSEFLNSMACEPTQKTFKLLMQNVCERGATDQSIQILEQMKLKSIPADEDVFNLLLYAHIAQGGLQAGESVLSTMKAAQIAESKKTNLAILNALASRNNIEEFRSALKMHKIDVNENQLLELVNNLGLVGHHEWLTEISGLYNRNNLSREFVNHLEQLCIHLVHMNRSDSAIAIYEHFVESISDDNYGFFLLKEMLHRDIDIDTIIKIGKHLLKRDGNEHILTNLTEIALRHNYVEASWPLLETLPELRPHYFWPLLINSYKNHGEIGLSETLQKINKLKVKLDFESLDMYVFRFCSLKEPQLLINKMKEYGYTVKELLSPMMLTLLEQKQINTVVNLCNLYDVDIYGDKILYSLAKAWMTTNNKSFIHILQRFCECNNSSQNDHVGEFLISSLKMCKNKNDISNYIEMLKIVNENKLKINHASLDLLKQIITEKNIHNEKLSTTIESILDFTLKNETIHIPHPNNMNLSELECHLIELEEKGMETRGVLRKLIQKYSTSGNIERVKELCNKFTEKGYEFSPGMRSSLMKTYIDEGCLKEAENVYIELKTKNSTFKIDEYKFLDLLELFVKENLSEKALQLLQSESNSKKYIVGGPNIEKNCWKLMQAYNDTIEQTKMINALLNYGYCKPTNIILGPVIRLQMKKDMSKAVEKYVEFAQKYKVTPLQTELLGDILEMRDEVLLQKVLNATSLVHGNVGTVVGLVSALAEKGLEKPLRKQLGSIKFSIKADIKNRCERWVTQKKLEPLITLRKASKNLSDEILDQSFINLCLIRLYSESNNCDAALELYENISESGKIDEKTETELVTLFKKCNYKIPENVKIQIK